MTRPHWRETAITWLLRLLIPLPLLLSGCADTCKNEAVARVDAPDGSHSAVLFQRDCGATTGFSTQVSVTGQGEKPTDGGNAFRADDNHGAASAGAWGGPWVEVKWLSSNRLLVRYAKNSRIFEQDGSVAGVSISFQEVSR